MCEQCGSGKVKVFLDMEAGTMQLCLNCYNERMSEELEVNLEQMVDSFSLKDYEGTTRTFFVEIHLYPTGICLEAVENIEFGYKFAVHGELNSNQQDLLKKLMDKTRKGIGEKQVETKVFPNGLSYYTLMNDQFTGLIECDEASDGVPLSLIEIVHSFFCLEFPLVITHQTN
ncbi:hypothetical protein [Neobacillus niacini]|uniref:DUF7686 domain-containing protein n=1 Tax=Neobacillus niacini TaxID=86668 RepID=UPI002855CFBA|nr:hypothetical protein [Neobacillus niacini]MDR7002175.1 hypothetical protein [Neobacillus niacini]